MILGGHRVFVDVMILQMNGFDLILGIDWLRKNYATIHCKDRKVEIVMPGMKGLKIQGLDD